MRKTIGFVVLSAALAWRPPVMAATDLGEGVPAQAVAVIEVDARPDGPALKHVYSGRNAHLLELFKAWLKAGAQQALVELSQKLDVEKDVLRWLDGRAAIVVLRSDKNASPVPYFVARVKNDALAQRSLTGMARTAEARGWVKFFRKATPKGSLFHLVLPRAHAEEHAEDEQNEEPEDDEAKPPAQPVPDICFGVRGRLLVVTETMGALEHWFTLVAEGKTFGATPAGAKLRALPDAVMKFYVRTAAFQPSDFSKLPFPVPLPGGVAGAREPNDDGDAETADQPAPAEQHPLRPLDMVDSILGAVTYSKEGVRYDVVATLGADVPEKVRNVLREWQQVRRASEELAAVVPAKTVLAVQVAAPGDLLAAFGVDLSTPEGWATFFGAPREEGAAPPAPPAAVRPLLTGDVLLCLPRLQRLNPPQEVEEAFNPLNFLPLTLVVRMRDAATAATAFSQLREWLTNNSPLQFHRLASATAWAVLLKDIDRPTPLAFATAAGPYLIVSRSVSDIAGARRRIAGSGGSLTDDSDYQEVLRALGDGAPVQFYLNLPEFLAQGGEVGLEAAHRPNRYLRPALKLTLAGLRGLGWTCRVREDAVHLRVFMAVDYELMVDAQALQMLALVAQITAPMFTPGRARERARQADARAQAEGGGTLEDLNNQGDCADNLGAVADAVLAYTRARGRYPDANHWVEEVKPYLKSAMRLHCPADAADHPCSYGFNTNLSRFPAAKLAHPEKTVLVFDCASDRPNPHGGPEALAFRHDGEAYVAYCDRHLEIVDHAPRTGWKPTGGQADKKN